VALTLLLAFVAGACGRGSSKPPIEGADDLPGGITVSSPEFKAGEPIPERFSCEGENLPPELRWTGVPAGVQQLAVVLEDVDAPSGTFVHWLVVGLPATATSVGLTDLPVEAKQLETSSGSPGWVGPCPPDGGGTHRYVFQVYALAGPVDIPAGTPPVDAARRVRTASTASGTYTGTFKR
jgi:Raf kinase inhibitor-like YbhB/YbcL family protein